ncbi:MAG: protein Mpv17 [Bacillariaceae sp.]|jgi:protein Mpv17
MRSTLVLAYIIFACLPLSSSSFTFSSIPAPSSHHYFASYSSLLPSRTKQLRLEALNQYSPTRTSTPFRFVRNFIFRQNNSIHQQPAKKQIINRLIEYIKMSALLKSYNSILANHPLKTEMFTSASLWFLGDILAQKLEHREKEKGTKMLIAGGVTASSADKKEKGLNQTAKTCSNNILEETQPRIDLKRTAIQTFYAGAIWGVAGHYWYQFLDEQALKFATEGTKVFIIVKLGVEMIFLHPIALFAFFTLVALLGGESIIEIKKQLRRDYWQTLLLELCLWTPLDLVNFIYVPVKHQLLVVNTACLLESIMLSYIKSNGLFSAVSIKNQNNQEIDKKKKE